jgi:hypothetical protein
MKPWNAWLVSLGMAGLCLTWVGCGGSGTPGDPDEPAAGAPAADAGAAPPEAAPVAEAAPAAPAETAPAPAPAPAPVAETAPAAAPAPADETAKVAEVVPPVSAPAEAAPSEATKPAEPSATAEMLKMANAPAPAPAPPPAAPPASGAAPGAPGATVEAAPGAAPAVATATPVEPPPAAAPAPDPGSSPFGSGGERKKADFRTPMGAVNAFLDALKAKDPDRLAEATALRAPTEASVKNQKLFTAILERSLAEDELGELNTKLDGFQIADHNVPKSTGRYSIILVKPGKNGATFRRTIYTRHEKAGWKVYDISGEGKVDAPIMIPRGGMRGRRR